jgi:hypothetical protein
MRIAYGTLASFFFILTCTGSSEAADRQQSINPVLLQSVTEWARCRSEKISATIYEERSAQSIVDDAMRDCKHFEEKVRILWGKIYGSGGAIQINKLSSDYRNNLINTINSTRSGGIKSPSFLYGQCIREHIPQNISVGLSSSSIADVAMSACSDQLTKVRQNFERSNNPQLVDVLMTKFSEQIRGQTISLINEEREK